MFDFEFHNPASLDDALQMLERYGEDARLMAGGTALVLQMKQRFAQPAHVIGLRSAGPEPTAWEPWKKPAGCSE